MTRKSLVHFPSGGSTRSAYSLINRRWMRGLEETGWFVIADGDIAPDAPDYIIHHNFEQHFTDFTRPATAVCIAVRPWDFGPYPPAWSDTIDSEFDQLWIHSSWSREMAVAGGVDPHRIRIVPLGVDEHIYCPAGDRFDLATRKSFRFVFVGGVSVRKGTDVLLSAYDRAFSRDDDVCMVIKDHSADVFYHDDALRNRVREQASDPRSPEILYLDEFLPEQRLAALFRACDVGVFPYRAEGFCLPILEAMACGIPSIVPDFGACLEYCDDSTSFLTPVTRVMLPVRGRFSLSLGFTESVEEVDFCEVRVGVLAKLLRQVYEADRRVLQRKARAGVSVACGAFTWSHSIAAVVSNLGSVDTPPAPRPPSSTS